MTFGIVTMGNDVASSYGQLSLSIDFPDRSEKQFDLG
jgi:hypothetical protein